MHVVVRTNRWNRIIMKKRASLRNNKEKRVAMLEDCVVAKKHEMKRVSANK